MGLGWDVGHENQTDPYKQEVKVERGVATNEWRKRSDYAFLSPNFRDVRFYVEAKKPHAGIDNPDFYFQTIRYGWNSHTPVAVLTDFEELRVLDCRYKPDIRTAIGHAVLKYHYTDYSDQQKFRTIYYLFSHESVLEGSIENFAKGLPKLSRKRALRGAAKDEHQNIDEAFLKELDEYREELARAFKRKNPELDSEALTEVTQRTLDEALMQTERAMVREAGLPRRPWFKHQIYAPGFYTGLRCENPARRARGHRATQLARGEQQINLVADTITQIAAAIDRATAQVK